MPVGSGSRSWPSLHPTLTLLSLFDPSQCCQTIGLIFRRPIIEVCILPLDFCRLAVDFPFGPLFLGAMSSLDSDSSLTSLSDVMITIDALRLGRLSCWTMCGHIVG
jgi:hypothetical protein